MALILVGLLLILFHREILWGLLCWSTKANKSEAGNWDLKLNALTKGKAPPVFLVPTGSKVLPESFCFSHFPRGSLWVAEDLWKLWEEPEREAFVLWSYSARLRYSNLSRLLGSFSAKTIDRDVQLTGGNSLALIQAIEKSIEFRAAHPLSGTGSFGAGLSLIGPSLFSDESSQVDRTKAIIQELEKFS